MFKITIPEGFRNEKEYILKVFFEDFLQYEFSVIVSDQPGDYIIERNNKRVVLSDVFFKNIYSKTKPTEPKVSKVKIYNQELPAWFISEKKHEYFTQVDIFGMAFFLLSGYADIKFSRRDDLERDIGKDSFVTKKGLIDRPIIQEWFLVLAQILLSGEELKKLNNRKFKPFISHDVDQPFEYLNYTPQRLTKRVLGDLVVRRSIKKALERVKRYVYIKRKQYVKDPYNNFAELLELLEKFNAKSTFFFVASDNQHPRDVSYNIEHPAIKEIIRQVNKRGHKIGVHPSFFTFGDKKKMVNEVQKLTSLLEEIGINKSVTHSRKHYLRWDWERSPENLSSAGITDDYTVGYADRSGFRVGVAFSYSAFCWQKKDILPLKLHPLIVMECTLTNARYMGLTYSEAETKVAEYGNLLKNLGGEYVVLWHNHVLINQEELHLFTKVLDISYAHLNVA